MIPRRSSFFNQWRDLLSNFRMGCRPWIQHLMNLDPVLEELIGILESHGVKIRRESLEDSRGGLCRLGGEAVLFLDMNADPLQSAALCAQTLCRITDINAIYLRPNLREFIESAAGNAQELP